MLRPLCKCLLSLADNTVDYVRVDQALGEEIIEYHLCVLCRQHAVFRCGLYLRMSHRSVVYVSVCLLATALSFAITYVPTETLFGADSRRPRST